MITYKTCSGWCLSTDGEARMALPTGVVCDAWVVAPGPESERLL